MTDVPHADVATVLEAHRTEQLRYEAFLQGYAYGWRDAEADTIITGPTDLRERTEDLFERLEGHDD